MAKIIDTNHPESRYMDAYLDGIPVKYVQALCLEEGWMDTIKTHEENGQIQVDIDELGQAIVQRLHGKVEIKYKTLL